MCAAQVEAPSDLRSEVMSQSFDASQAGAVEGTRTFYQAYSLKGQFLAVQVEVSSSGRGRVGVYMISDFDGE